jgi:hypothetical protein
MAAGTLACAGGGRCRAGEAAVDDPALATEPRAVGGALSGDPVGDAAGTQDASVLVVVVSGIPLAVTLTGGNRNDVTHVVPLLDDLAARSRSRSAGRPRHSLDLGLAHRGH